MRQQRHPLRAADQTFAIVVSLHREYDVLHKHCGIAAGGAAGSGSVSGGVSGGGSVIFSIRAADSCSVDAVTVARGEGRQEEGQQHVEAGNSDACIGGPAAVSSCGAPMLVSVQKIVLKTP